MGRYQESSIEIGAHKTSSFLSVGELGSVMFGVHLGQSRGIPRRNQVVRYEILNDAKVVWRT